MSVSSILAQTVNSVYSLTSANQQTGSTDATTNTNSTDSVSTQISKPGKMLAELQQLASSDPAKFKQVTSEIADKLQQAAQQDSGNSATFLNNLADKFRQASQTGDASALAPNKNSQQGSLSINSLQSSGGAKAHHGHHHHHADNDANSSSSSTSSASLSAANGYAAQSTDPFKQVENIIESALTDPSTTSTSATS